MFEKKTCALLFNVAIVTNINAFHFFFVHQYSWFKGKLHFRRSVNSVFSAGADPGFQVRGGGRT